MGKDGPSGKRAVVIPLTDIEGPFPVSQADIENRRRFFSDIDDALLPSKFQLGFRLEESCGLPIQNAVPHHVVEGLCSVSCERKMVNIRDPVLPLRRRAICSSVSRDSWERGPLIIVAAYHIGEVIVH